ncbi:MAG: IspD/TarI family cytidylyltransferase [Pseudonocardia sp.]
MPGPTTSLLKVTVTVAAAVVLAGGAGTRLGAGRNKVYLPLAGRPVLAWSLAVFAGMPEIGPLVLVVRPGERARAQALLDADPDLSGRPGLRLVDGGASRQESELAGLRALAGPIRAGTVDAVLVHDGARPLVTAALAREVLAVARAHGGAVPGVACGDLAVVGPGGGPGAASGVGPGAGAVAAAGAERLAGPAPPGLVAVQTPQGFRAAPLLAACEAAVRHGFAGTDTASCVERFGTVTVRWVPADPGNIKITYPHDLRVAATTVTAGRAVG